MRVTKDMIHPELQTMAKIGKLMNASPSPKSMARSAKMIKRMMKGRCWSKNLNYEQIYLERSGKPQLRLCVYSPKVQQEKVPGLLWLHGGGYGKGVPEQDEGFIKRFVAASGCVVVAPDYRTSIEEPYPAALEDCYAGLLWLRKNGKKYGMNENQIMVGGDSAGGGLTAAITLYARDLGEVAIAFQMPLYPMIDDRMNTPSAVDNDAPVWDARSNKVGWQLYLGSLFDQKEVPVYAAPARNTDFRQLPPALSFVGSVEPFRDETKEYMQHLQADGIPVKFKVFEGAFHAFDILSRNSSIGKEATAFLMDGFDYAVKNYFAEQPPTHQSNGV